MCKGMAIVTQICVLLALCLSLVATQPVFNCSLIPVSERVSCSVPSPNATTCQGTGCCWDPGNPNLMCFTKPGGRCIPYHKSGLCYDALNSTLPEYRDWPRFIDNRLGYPMTELFISGVQDAIRDSASDFPECQRILSAMLCQYTLVPCRGDHTLMSFCKEDCEAIFRSCQQPLNQAIGGAKQLAKFKNIEFVHIGFPNCSNYKYSNEYDKSSNNNTCIRTGFFSFQKPKPKGKDDGKDVSILAIVLPIVIVVFILIVVVIIFVMRRQMRKRENALANSNFLVNKDAMTMRQKLRADSLKNIDQRLMRLYDPEKLQHYPLDRVEYVKDLGEGHFGKVFQGRANLQGKPNTVIPVAVKALKEGSSKELKEEFYQEVALMSILDHPNVVKLLAVSTEEEPYGMIFEFMGEGDLNHYLRSAKPAESSAYKGPDDAKVFLSKEDLVCIAEQVAAGMEYVASLRFVHRDLATRNCLVGTDMVVKIADFGMSRDVYGSDYYKMSRETMLPIRWLAPEAFLYGKFTVKSDVYSYGVLLWEIFTFGLQPYYGYTNKEVTEFIKKGIHLGRPDDCPQFVYLIMKDCWSREPEERVDFGLIQKRLRDPYGNYDTPKLSRRDDSPDGATPDPGNYDIPRSPDNEYDVPPIDTGDNENGDYDVPKSPEDVQSSTEDVPSSSKQELPNYDMPLTTPAKASNNSKSSPKGNQATDISDYPPTKSQRIPSNHFEPNEEKDTRPSVLV